MADDMVTWRNAVETLAIWANGKPYNDGRDGGRYPFVELQQRVEDLERSEKEAMDSLQRVEKSSNLSRIGTPIAMALFEEQPEVLAIEMKLLDGSVNRDALLDKVWGRSTDPANVAEHAARVRSEREAARIISRMKDRRAGEAWGLTEEEKDAKAANKPTGIVVSQACIVVSQACIVVSQAW